MTEEQTTNRQSQTQEVIWNVLFAIGLILFFSLASGSCGYSIGKGTSEDTYKMKLEGLKREFQETLDERVRFMQIEASNRGFGTWQIRRGKIEFVWKPVEIDSPNP